MKAQTTVIRTPGNANTVYGETFEIEFETLEDLPAAALKHCGIPAAEAYLPLLPIADEDNVVMGYFCRFASPSGEEIRLLFEGDDLWGEDIGSFYEV